MTVHFGKVASVWH